ncbi:MAG: 50S ribosomal protein L35 [Patescibacteria group bacterium]|nr:50S ribosomal protein L35 [Patescibacteria group bacterium]MDD4610670.1 50S ribosomal protein L35 [Patescibacteria group bacterium]
MGKLKTHKATAKRYSVTGSGKLKRRKAGQDHFNAKEPGKVTRLKRRDIGVNKTSTKTIKTLIPYN